MSTKAASDAMNAIEAHLQQLARAELTALEKDIETRIRNRVLDELIAQLAAMKAPDASESAVELKAESEPAPKANGASEPIINRTHAVIAANYPIGAAQISDRLGVSRLAVTGALQALRKRGQIFQKGTNRKNARWYPTTVSEARGRVHGKKTRKAVEKRV